MVGPDLTTVQKPRVVILGAGPAGTRCAQTLVKTGIRPLVIDENQRSGGQIYRRQPDNFQRSAVDLYGSDAGKAISIHNTFDELADQIDYWPESLVWNIRGNKIYLVRDNQQYSIEFSSLVICSGATDRLLPMPGWNYAGCYSLGGAQIALKSQACAIGNDVVLIGTGPLLYLIAAQYHKAGAQVAAVLDTSSFSKRILAMPELLANPKALYQGLLLTASLIKAGVPLYTGITPLEVNGTSEEGVDGISFLDRRNRRRQIDCDAVGMGYHLRPETQLADLAHCAFEFDELSRQWLVATDDLGRSSVSGVYLAGDGARVLGAEAAEASGELAALTLLKDSGLPSDQLRTQLLRQTLARLQRFANGLSKAFPWPHQLVTDLPDDTVLCRCEAVTVGELRNTIETTGASETNRAKAFSRVGMGRCQGRFCANASTEIIAAKRNEPIHFAGRQRSQAPIKPILLAITNEETS